MGIINIELPPRFLVDCMLGTLARWLRLCGYDTEYHNDCEDDILLEKAIDGDLILVTRDRELNGRARKRGITSVLVENSSYVEQLAYVKKVIGLELHPQSTRCSNCNNTIRKAEKETIKSKIPDRTYNAYEEFWICDSCGKVYWKGSHWTKIVETLKKANRVFEQDL